MGAPERQAWEPPEWPLIMAYLRVTTFHPTAGDIAAALNIRGIKLTPILGDMIRHGLIRKSGISESTHRNWRYLRVGEDTGPPTRACELASCGKEFTPKSAHPGQRFCNAKCHHESQRVHPVRRCANCGVEFRRTRSTGRGKKFCGHKCRGEWAGCVLDEDTDKAIGGG